MPNFMLNFTHGDIRAILQKEYHDEKGLKRKLRGDQSGIAALEAAMKKRADEERVSFDDLANYIDLTYNIYSANRTKSTATRKEEKKSKAHVRCSDKLLTFFAEKFFITYYNNELQRLKEAIQHNDLDFMRKAGLILTLITNHQTPFYKFQSVIWYGPHENSIPMLIKKIYTEHYMALHKHSDLITRLFTNIDIFSAISSIPFMPHLLRELVDKITPDQKTLFDQIMNGSDPGTHIGNFYQRAREKPDSLVQFTDFSPYQRRFYVAALLTNNPAANLWIKTSGTPTPDIREFHPDFLAHIIKNAEGKSLDYFLAKNITTGKAYLGYHRDYENMDTLSTLIFATFTRNDFDTITPLLLNAYQAKLRYDIRNIATAMMGPVFAIIQDDQWVAKNDNILKLKALLSKLDLNLENEKWLDRALESKNPRLFIFMAQQGISNHLLRFHRNKIIDRIAQDDFDINIFISTPFLASLITIILHGAYGPHRLTSQLSNSEVVFKKVIALGDIGYQALINHFLNPSPTLTKEFGQILGGTLVCVVEQLPYDQNTLLNMHFFHNAFSLSDEIGQQWIVKQYPDLTTEFITHNAYAAIARAIDTGTNGSQLDWLIDQLPPDNIKMMLISMKDRVSALFACSTNQTKMLDLFSAYYPEGILGFITDPPLDITLTTKPPQSHAVIQWFLDNKTSKEYIMTTCSIFTRELFLLAAQSNHLAAMKIMAAHHPQLIRYNNFAALIAAKDHPETVQWLLMHDECFDHAESAPEYLAYRNLVQTHVITYLNALRKQDETPNPTELNLNPTHLYLILRRLIRHHSAREDIELLLFIPSLRDFIAGTCREKNNELLRLALRSENNEAANALLQIDAIRELAEENDYYQNSGASGVDLRALANNRESSMVQLNETERYVLDSALKHYKPLLDSKSIEGHLETLKKDIIKHYESDPATIETKNKKILRLPLLYQDFMALKLKDKEYKEALTAYYKHTVHGAFRFLSRPNFWIHPNANYVNVNPANRNEHWASTDRSHHLIAMMYLAALDKETPCVREFTPETKISHFFIELAYINRGHNTDDGPDDYQEGDRPSCGPGMDRRLFQSVPGNPRVNVLTKDQLSQEIGSFALDHFNSLFTKSNIASTFFILDAFIVEGQTDHFMIDNTEHHIAELAVFNIPREKIEAFRDDLKERCGNHPLVVGTYFNRLFELSSDANDIANHYHIITLSGLSGVYTHLETLAKKIQAKPSGEGLFAPKKEKPTQPKNKSTGLRRGD